jgi:hypothetical protein
MKKLIDAFVNGEWVAGIVFLETAALSVTEATGVLPDGSAKVAVLAVAGALTMALARLRAWSAKSVDALGRGPTVSI